MYSNIVEHAGQLTTNVRVSIQNCVKPTAHGSGCVPHAVLLPNSKAQKAGGKGHLSSRGEVHTLKLVSQVGGAAHIIQQSACSVHAARPKRERARRDAKPAVAWLPSAAGGPVVKALGVVCGRPAPSPITATSYRPLNNRPVARTCVQCRHRKQEAAHGEPAHTGHFAFNCAVASKLGQKLCILVMYAHWTARLLWWNRLRMLKSLRNARTNSCQ